MTTNLSRIKFKKCIATYLAELKEITAQDIDSKDLTSPEEAERLATQASLIKDKDTSKLIFEFNKKDSSGFKELISSLAKCNGKPVYIWTPRTKTCGLYKPITLESINFSFDFDINSEGIIVFTTEDFSDEIILDFYKDESDNKMLEFEVKGINWVPLEKFGPLDWTK